MLTNRSALKVLGAVDDCRPLKETSPNPARAKAAFNNWVQQIGRSLRRLPFLLLRVPHIPRSCKQRTMKFPIPFSKSRRKSRKEKEKDTTSNNVDGVDRCIGAHKEDEQDELTNTAEG